MDRLLSIIALSICGPRDRLQQNTSDSFTCIPRGAKLNIACYLGVCNDGALQLTSTEHAGIVKTARRVQIHYAYRQLIEHSVITAEEIFSLPVCGALEVGADIRQWNVIQSLSFVLGRGPVVDGSGMNMGHYLMVKVMRQRNPLLQVHFDRMCFIILSLILIRMPFCFHESSMDLFEFSS